MKKILFFLFFSIFCFSAKVKNGAYYDATSAASGEVYFYMYKDDYNPDGYSFEVVYDLGNDNGICYFYNVNNPKVGTVYGTCEYSGRRYKQLDGTIFKFEFMENGNLKMNSRIYRPRQMTTNNLRQILYYYHSKY